MNLRLTIRQVMGCYLALALLMVPLFGLMHGIVHGASHGLSAAAVSANSLSQVQTSLRGFDTVHSAGAHEAGNAAPAWSGKLFASHDKASDCLVFDQLCHFQALHFLTLQVLPAPLPSFVLVTLTGDFISRWAVLFQARGPPSAR